MGKILFYGTGTVILLTAFWYYRKGEAVPDSMMPYAVLLFAFLSFSYGLKAKEDGDIGAGSGKIRRDSNPRIFGIAMYFNHCITGGLLLLAIWLFMA